jgi:hypothetical protein
MSVTFARQMIQVWYIARNKSKAVALMIYMIYMEYLDSKAFFLCSSKNLATSSWDGTSK